MVRRERDGLLVPPRDPDALAEAIRTLPAGAPAVAVAPLPVAASLRAEVAAVLKIQEGGQVLIGDQDDVAAAPSV